MQPSTLTKEQRTVLKWWLNAHAQRLQNMAAHEGLTVKGGAELATSELKFKVNYNNLRYLAGSSRQGSDEKHLQINWAREQKPSTNKNMPSQTPHSMLMHLQLHEFLTQHFGATYLTDEQITRLKKVKKWYDQQCERESR